MHLGDRGQNEQAEQVTAEKIESHRDSKFDTSNRLSLFLNNPVKKPQQLDKSSPQPK
jgi:hypothetical protein